MNLNQDIMLLVTLWLKYTLYIVQSRHITSSILQSHANTRQIMTKHKIHCPITKEYQHPRHNQNNHNIPASSFTQTVIYCSLRLYGPCTFA
jgi:hypothetical protein